MRPSPRAVTISAIVCAYNEAPTLPACLHSLLAQSRPPDEVIVVNSASTDETGTVANSHIVALNLTEYISADQPAEDILKEIRRQGAFSIACHPLHPHHRTPRRIEISTCYLWDNRKRLVEVVDVWEGLGNVT